MTGLKLGAREIHEETPPYIIAEIGVNHEGSLEKAKELIRLAKEGGADAAKFQTYRADRIASRNSPAYWDLSKEPTTNQFELFKKHDRFREKEYEQLAEYSRQIGIDFLSTPFDLEAVDFLDPWMTFHKIASADITSIPLLRRVAKKGKPVVLSTGSSTLAEVDIAVNELEQNGCSQIGLMHCILNYPTNEKNAHLGMMLSLKRAFPQYLIGYSDHTVPDNEMFVLTASVSMGARIIEKHFTFDKTLTGNDHYHAMDVNDLKKFKANIQRLREITGDNHKHPIATENLSRSNARRSIVIDRPVRAGETITESMLTFKRPAFGISPLEWDRVQGMKAVHDLEEDHVLQWSDLEG